LRLLKQHPKKVQLSILKHSDYEKIRQSNQDLELQANPINNGPKEVNKNIEMVYSLVGSIARAKPHEKQQLLDMTNVDIIVGSYIDF
jgi:hypothetical protein